MTLALKPPRKSSLIPHAHPVPSESKTSVQDLSSNTTQSHSDSPCPTNQTEISSLHNADSNLDVSVFVSDPNPAAVQIVPPIIPETKPETLEFGFPSNDEQFAGSSHKEQPATSSHEEQPSDNALEGKPVVIAHEEQSVGSTHEVQPENIVHDELFVNNAHIGDDFTTAEGSLHSAPLVSEEKDDSHLEVKEISRLSSRNVSETSINIGLVKFTSLDATNLSDSMSSLTRSFPRLDIIESSTDNINESTPVPKKSHINDLIESEKLDRSHWLKSAGTSQ